MRRHIFLILSLALVAPGSLNAGTFDHAPLAPELGVDALNRGVTRERVGRDLFANPYATVTIENVDVYDRFPYVEARSFQIVSDPAWNRLVTGESGKSLRAFDGRGTALGALKNPRGLAVDDRNRVYVADAGNNRVLVLEARMEYGVMNLVPLFAIDGLHDPHGVAFSDGGTPFVSDDDVLYVSDTGKNRVVAFALEASGAREVASIGELGSGMGHFAGPMAVAVGRANGINTPDVYVADAHTRRLVHLRHDASGLAWVSERPVEADIITSLDSDQWGNVYAVAPNQGVVQKFNADLAPVAELRSEVVRPRGFHVPFVNVRDHRTGTVVRQGRANGVLVEEWSAASGMRLWNLGVEVRDLAVNGAEHPTARFTLTDHAALTLELTDAATGRRLVQRNAGTFAAGAREIALTDDDMTKIGGASQVLLRVSAASSYANGPSDVAFVSLSGSNVVPNQPVLFANSPNPVSGSTRIAFMLPVSTDGNASLRVFDASGRVVRTFERRFEPGINEIFWDGTDRQGRTVQAGVYFYRLNTGGMEWSRKMIVVR